MRELSSVEDRISLAPILLSVWAHFLLSPQLCGGDFGPQGEQAAAHF